MKKGQLQDRHHSEVSGRRILPVALLPLLIFLALAAIFLIQLSQGGADTSLPSALIDKPVPQTELSPLVGLKNENGDQLPGFDNSSFKGKITLLNIWASWCAPCRKEHPVLMKLAKDGRFQIIGLNYKNSNANALGFLNQLGNPFNAVGVDPSGRAAIDWGVYGVPETFIIDAQGRIAAKYVGELSEKVFTEQLEPVIEKALVTAQ